MTKEFELIKPDLIILQIFIGNDFYDVVNYDSLGTRVFLQKFKQEVRTLHFLWTRLIQVRYISDFLFNSNLRHLNKGIFLRKYPALEQKGVDMEIGFIKKIHEVCNSKGLKMLLIIIPTREQILKRDFLNNSKYHYKKPNDILKEFCRLSGISYVDFLDEYEKKPENLVKEFYYKYDVHWTAKGYRDAAELISDFILGLEASH